MAQYDYDLFVIGAGSGGVRAARLAAQYGAKVAIAEGDRIGGTCVIRGCVPKKLLVYASEFADSLAHARGYGWSAKAEFDWPTLIANVSDEVDRLSGVYSRNLRNAGVDVFEARAALADAHTIRLSSQNREVSARIILIAAGASPFIDRDVKGWDLGVTSNEVFHLEALPRQVVIAGGGYIAVEFACIFKGLGSEVALVYRGEDVLRHFDRDISVAVHAELKRMGVRVTTGATFESIDDMGRGVRRVQLSNGASLDADLVLWAIGRVPNTGGLGLEEAGVQLNARGAVAVDAFSKSSVENIYAIGDVTDRLNLTPVAIRDGAAFAETVFNNRPTRIDHAFTPSAVFSQPPVGTVGYSEADARRRFKSIDIYRTEFRPMKNTLSGSESRTMMKLVADGESDRVIGAHIVGPDAPEMIQCLAIAVKAGITKRQFDDTTALHPTAAEELVLLREKANAPLSSQA